MRQNFHNNKGARFAGSSALVLVLAAAIGTPVHAIGIDTGNPNLEVRWDTSARYNAGWRVEKENSAFANSVVYDETERKFDRGDMVLNRLDLLTELDVVSHGRHGFRVSAAGWYDQAYHNTKAKPNPALPGSGSYIDNEYSDYTKRYHHGPSGEILDAFMFTGFEIGDASVNVRAGRHTVFWGESLFTTFHGISYSQAPMDGLKAASSPGITAKEVFLPLNQISLQVQPTPELELAAQYYLEWQPNRLPQGGTFFGNADNVYEGPDQMYPGKEYNGPRPLVPRHRAIEPDKHAGNNFGLAARWSPMWLGGTVGAYFRKFDETQPWISVLEIDPASPLPVGYHQAYAEDTKMFGLSLTKTIASISVGSELIYRHNTALNSSASFAAAGDFAGIEGARGKTLHFLVNGIYLLPETPLWNSGTLQAELIYSHLLDVTKNEQVFKHVDYNGCGASEGKRDGCATDDVVLLQVGFRPEWPQALAGVNLAAPISASYGLHGNGATLGGGNEGAYSWSVGLEANVYSKYLISLKYNDQYARYTTSADGVVNNVSGNAVQNNHGWVSLAFQTTF